MSNKKTITIFGTKLEVSEDEYNTFKKVSLSSSQTKPRESTKKLKEDLTIDQYIKKYGAIQSMVDKSYHTTKQGYLEHLKQNDRVIKDWDSKE